MVRMILILFALLTGTLFPAQRGLWIVRNSLTSKTDLVRLGEISRQLKLTDVYFQVRALGRNFIPFNNKKNPLDLHEIIHFCERHHIRFHAWINVCYVSNVQLKNGKEGAKILVDVQHVLTDPTGNFPALDQLRKDGVEGYFVDPAAAQNTMQVKKLIRKLLTEYDLQGIHLDYFRLPPEPWHYSNYLRSKFLGRYFLDPAAVQHYAAAYFAAYGADSYRLMQQRYRDFLQREITEGLKNLTSYIQFLKPGIPISVAVKPDMGMAKIQFGQDWANWLDEQACDYVVVMNYAPDHETFRKNLLKAKRLHKDHRIVMGIGAYYLDGAQIAERIREIGEMGYRGYSLFSFTTLKVKPELLAGITGTSFNKK